MSNLVSGFGLYFYANFLDRGRGGCSTLFVVEHPGLGKGLVGRVAGQHDFRLDFHILKGGVAFLKIIVPHDEAVDDFSGQPNAGRAVLGHVAVFLAKLIVPGRLDRVPHFHAVPNFHIRQGAHRVQTRQIPRGGVQRVHIKPGIVGTDGDHLFSLAQGAQLVHDLEEGADFALALGDVGVIPRELLGVIAGLHALDLAEEDFADNVGTAEQDVPGGGFDKGEADVIGQVVAGLDFLGGEQVAGLGVEDDDLVGHGINSFLLLIT